MLSKEIQRTISRLLGYGVPLTSMLLFTSGVTDPVNVTKMFMAGGIGIASLTIFIVFGLKASLLKYRTTLIFVFMFLLACINALIFSKAPKVQVIYGTFGRNTGFLTYLFMISLLLGALLLENKNSYKILVGGLVVTGAVNILYCAWVLAFGDFLSWSNPYGNILGLFGNPNFISAFLGMFITAAVAISFYPKLNIWNRLALLLLSALAFFEVLKSNAIQGVVVTVGGMGIIGFYFIYAKTSRKILPISYLFFALILGTLAVLGTLQKGPFKFVYKRSVSLRGSYWQAGIDMGNRNPFHGIGFDTYGDWYRRSRPPVAVVDMPGVNIVSNVSHNVVIDFFAAGGWPLLVSYILLLTLGIRSIYRITVRNRKYDALFVAIAATWMCYQTQSLISINQVGLTVWGWVLTGALISYEKLTPASDNLKEASKTKVRFNSRNSSNPFSPALVASIGAAVGFFVAAPALNADMTWQSANRSRNLESVKNALAPTYMNPENSFKYAQAVDLFQRSNLNDLAREYSLKAVKFNPDYFDAWKQIYFLPSSSSDEKAEALKNMKRLDPLNPDVTSVK